MKILRAVIGLVLIISLFTGCESNIANPPVVPAELSVEEEIIYDYYYNATSLDFQTQHFPDEISLRFRGAFSDTYVVFVDGPFEYSTENINEYVNGIRFHFPMGKRLFAYHQGTFYTLTDAFELGFLTAANVEQLKINYSSLGTDRDVKGEVPTEWAECAHNGNAPSTEPTIESTPPVTVTQPTEPTTPTETTAPTEPIDIMELLPDIPAVTEPCEKPEVMSAETLVYTLYDRNVTWTDKWRDQQSVTIRLPAVLPFCDGAVEINKEISIAAEYRLYSIRRDYTNQSRAYYEEISYTATLSGNILSITISTRDDQRNVYHDIWNLDIETGESLNTIDLAQRYLQESYPVFMQHCYYNTIEYFKANPLVDADQQEKLLQQLNAYPLDTVPGHTLHLNENGNLMVTFQAPQFSVKMTLPFTEFDSYRWEGTDEGGYTWMFNVRPSEGSSEGWSDTILECFLLDPQQFVKYLSLEETATISKIARRLNSPLYLPEDIADYTALCESIRDNADNPKVAETAQILLDALDQPR
ncbi:MAG: hypothetical protein J6A88_04975 [Oscillospiraceae bacterium]|nr:hypothetical protein [Oscillospiraceae bacterium]